MITIGFSVGAGLRQGRGIVVGAAPMIGTAVVA
jgi:hypothetical protein